MELLITNAKTVKSNEYSVYPSLLVKLKFLTSVRKIIPHKTETLIVCKVFSYCIFLYFDSFVCNKYIMKEKSLVFCSMACIYSSVTRKITFFITYILPSL